MFPKCSDTPDVTCSSCIEIVGFCAFGSSLRSSAVSMAIYADENAARAAYAELLDLSVCTVRQWVRTVDG